MLNVDRDVRVLLLSISSKLLLVQITFENSRISFVFGCGLSASAGNLLKYFSCYCKKSPMRVIYRAGNHPEITLRIGNAVIGVN